MKLYKLRFTQNEFVSKQPNVWRTGVIDLYNNTQYKNYSARRANYGTDLLGNGIYTGLNSADNVNSEIGFVDGGRFLDTSGTIDIQEWKLSVSQAPVADIDLKLNIYTTEEAGLTPYYLHATPSLVNDWVPTIGLVPGQPAYKLNSERYCFFEIDFASDADINPNADVELIVAVEIHPPVVNGFFPATRRALDRFPEWMEMREYDPEDLTDENKATPTKLGSLFINSVSGEWLTDLRGKIGYQEFQKHIENVDLDQKAWAWRTSGVPIDVFSVKYNNGSGDIQLTYTSGLSEFYQCSNTEHAFFHNRLSSEIYTLQEYVDFKINGTVYNQELYHIWNAIDDLGVVVDLFRLHGEDNDSFRKRILDVYRSKPGVSAERFKTSLRRELNLWKYFSATPDSDFVGATPELLTIEDIENSDQYFDVEGNPKEKFYELVSHLGKKYPMTWGLFRYGEALWDSDGLYHKGFKSIPKQFDTATPSLADYQSGVGDVNDLYVLRPDFYKPEQDFDITLAVRGKRQSTVAQYTEIEFEAQVTGIANRTIATYGSNTKPFHLEVISNGVTYVANLNINASYYAGDPGDINLQNYTPGTTWPPPAVSEEAKTYVEWFTPDGFSANYLLWFQKTNGLSVLGQINLSTVTSVVVKPGYWVPATQTITQVPNSNYYQLKFADSTLTAKLGYLGTASITESTPNFATEDLRLQYQAWDFVVLENNAEGFVSTPQPIRVKINADNVLMTAVVPVGNFEWPEYNAAGTETHKIRVQLTDTNDIGEYGAYTKNGTFISENDINVNGSVAWTDGVLTLTLGSPMAPGATHNLSFGCTTATDYPEDVASWVPLYATQVSPLTDQKVNEHGPYRYGLPPRVGNSDRTLATLVLERSDFGLLAGDVVTWVGVDSVSNDNVIVWTDTNSIVPFGEDASIYPSNALVETASELGTLIVSAKLKPNLNPEWNPFLHSGWFYEDGYEYYLFAEPESSTIQSGTPEIIIYPQPQQGAPIVAIKNTGASLRQIAQFNSATPLFVTETKFGTGTDSLFVGYPNISNVYVYNKSLGEVTPTTQTTFLTNEIKTSTPTNKTYEYEITYKPKDSFVIDNLATPGQTKLMFSEMATVPNYYVVTWESSQFNPATPIEIPLHPVYSTMTEGFIYIDHDEYDLDYVEAQISPSHMLATPGDYALITLQAYDKYGNPKPNVVFDLNAPGDVTLSSSSVTTDAVGHAFFYVEAENNSASGVVSATPTNFSATPVDISYEMRRFASSKKRVMAVMDSNTIIADNISGTTLFGYVYDELDNPVTGVNVFWRKGRNVKELLINTATSNSTATPGDNGRAGRVTTDSNGRFTVGPFISQDEPGYWLVSVESQGAGDISYWYEYLNSTNILDPVTYQPFFSVQQATPPYLLEDYYATPAFPVTLDEQDYLDTPTGAGPEWSPPSWFPISRYQQYQMGLLGNAHYDVDTSATPPYDDSVES